MVNSKKISISIRIAIRGLAKYKSIHAESISSACMLLYFIYAGT